MLTDEECNFINKVVMSKTNLTVQDFIDIRNFLKMDLDYFKICFKIPEVYNETQYLGYDIERDIRMYLINTLWDLIPSKGFEYITDIDL